MPEAKLHIEPDLLENFGTGGLALPGIFAQVSAEFWRARALHGDQTDLPLGTGPERVLLTEVASYAALDPVEVVTNQEAADAARHRCKDAVSTAEGDTWEKIVTEEFLETMAESDPAKFEAEAIQCIAMLVNAIMAARKTRPTSRRDCVRCTGANRGAPHDPTCALA